MSYYDLLSRPVRPPDRVLRYGDRHPDQVIDVYEGTGRPPLVLLHGGYWLAEYDRSHTRPMAAALAALGHTVWLPEYRRVGQEGGGHPGTFDDVAAALDLVRAECPSGVLLVGHSAGGHLALWSALRHRLPPGSRWHAEPAVNGVVGLAAVCDLGEAFTAGLGGGAARALLHDRADLLDEVDPMRLLPHDRGPLVLVHGVRDRVLPVSMSRRMAAGETSAVLVEPADAGHFSLIDPLSSTWPLIVAAVEAAAAYEPGPAEPGGREAAGQESSTARSGQLAAARRAACSSPGGTAPSPSTSP
ncbi:MULTISPECIES: alpha/beta hydrolase [unclassified Nonomuraea]|uniref:alpha/beta hydrolase family protein n=1 Tax=unclassified Nonomuraea TaxID=2593643 RepID=UPI0033D22020